MKNLVLAGVCIFLYFVTLTDSLSIPAEEDSVILRRQVRDVDCGSKDCKDCLGSCSGCDQCPLCAFCFIKTGPCENCKYCTGDNPTESCKKKCEKAKDLPKCKACKKSCWTENLNLYRVSLKNCTFVDYRPYFWNQWI